MHPLHRYALHWHLALHLHWHLHTTLHLGVGTASLHVDQPPTEQLSNFLDTLALFLPERPYMLEHCGEVNIVLFEALLDNVHTVLNSTNFALQFNEFFGDEVSGEHQLFNVVRGHGCVLRAAYVVLHLDALRFQGLAIAIKFTQSDLIIVNFVIKNLIVSVHCYF